MREELSLHGGSCAIEVLRLGVDRFTSDSKNEGTVSP